MEFETNPLIVYLITGLTFVQVITVKPQHI